MLYFGYFFNEGSKHCNNSATIVSDDMLTASGQTNTLILSFFFSFYFNVYWGWFVMLSKVCDLHGCCTFRRNFFLTKLLFWYFVAHDTIHTVIIFVNNCLFTVSNNNYLTIYSQKHSTLLKLSLYRYQLPCNTFTLPMLKRAWHYWKYFDYNSDNA